MDFAPKCDWVGFARVVRKTEGLNMRKFIGIAWLTVGMAALVSAAAGCNRQRTVHSLVSATVAGREIIASIEVPAGLYPDIDPATILASARDDYAPERAAQRTPGK